MRHDVKKFNTQQLVSGANDADLNNCGVTHF